MLLARLFVRVVAQRPMEAPEVPGDARLVRRELPRVRHRQREQREQSDDEDCVEYEDDCKGHALTVPVKPQIKPRIE